MQLARAALKRLTLARQEPTPQNYARAWREVGGEDLPEPPSAAVRTATAAVAARMLPAGEAREQLAGALAQHDWLRAEQALEQAGATPAQQAGAWADLIDRAVRQTARGTKTWPVGRKNDSLQRVLQSSRSDPQRLQQRLGQLLSSWDDDTPEGVSVAGDAPAPVGAAPQAPSHAPAAADQPGGAGWSGLVGELESTLQVALPASDQRALEVGQRLNSCTQALGERGPLADLATELRDSCAEVRRVLALRHHLTDQMSALVRELTDGLGTLVEDDSWVEGQCVAMREQIETGLTPRGVRAVAELLRGTRERQMQLRAERAQARDALKQLIHRMLQDIAELGEHTGRFSDNVTRYAEVIGQADSLEGLAGVVREMVEETHTVSGLVAQTTRRLQDEHARAAEMADRVRQLEDELRQLSQEVGTDQLTQVANRRGLLRIFATECDCLAREPAPFAIALLDIDNFKRLNDTLGHQTGDEALKFLARRVGERLRPTDSLARYGGEEFVVLLPRTELPEAQQVLTRVQRQMSAELFMHEDKQTFVTFSAGVTLYRGGETIEAALQRADEALYEAKRTGKNRTCMA